MSVTVADIIKLMERIAPSRLAEPWDNPGLQVGRKDWPVKAVQVALDPTDEVVTRACEKGADILITHHPLIFRPLKTLDFSSSVGSVIHKAIQSQMAIFAAHTNLDSVAGGVNDLLASKIGLKNITVLGKPVEQEIYKLVLYVPREYEHKILNALFETEAGQIGDYSCCSFRNPGKGTFSPGGSATPFTGEVGTITHADEIRIEAVVRKQDIQSVIRQVREHHPYQTMAYDLYPLVSQESRQGLGRVGYLDEKTDLRSLALKIKDRLNLKSVRITGRPDLPVTRVALCSGSGSSMMKDFFSSGADVYVSGDLHYHDARDAEAVGRGLIDAGHFASEIIIVEALRDQIIKLLSETGAEVNVEACNIEKDPFVSV